VGMQGSAIGLQNLQRAKRAPDRIIRGVVPTIVGTRNPIKRFTLRHSCCAGFSLLNNAHGVLFRGRKNDEQIEIKRERAKHFP
jgi:hypothetical protein